MEPFSIILMIIYIIVGVSGITLIKLGSLPAATTLFTVPLVNVAVSWQTIFGIACYGLSFVLYIILIAKLDLSFLTPVVTAVNYILIMVVAFLIFGEQFTPVKIIGCSLIIIGVLMVVINKPA